MKKEAVFVRDFVPSETQGGANLFEDFLRVGPAALIGDAQRREAEAGGGDAGHVTRVVAFRGAAVFGETRLGMGLLEKKLCGSFGDFVEQLIVGLIQRAWRGGIW